MMYEDDIAKVDNWFDRHTENYGTYRIDREYSLSDWDMQEFADFLRKEFPDLIGIRCYFGTGDSKVWFFREDLEKASFY